MTSGKYIRSKEMKAKISATMKPPQKIAKNKCNECGTVLVKTYILTQFNIPFICWVCPKSEMFKEYERLFKSKYHKNS
jgi:hypothetical protein